jgi:hypothetical protein
MSLFSITPIREEGVGTFVSVDRRRDLYIINAKLVSVVEDLIHTRDSGLCCLLTLNARYMCLVCEF